MCGCGLSRVVFILVLWFGVGMILEIVLVDIMCVWFGVIRLLRKMCWFGGVVVMLWLVIMMRLM